MKTSPLSCLVLLPGLLALAQPADEGDDYWLGARGPFPTGTRYLEWTDPARDDPFTSAADQRRILVQIWYPAEPAADSVRAPYAPHLPLFHEQTQGFVGPLASRVTRSWLDAPPAAGGALPLLVYNHGGGAQFYSGTGISEFLASHGYVVASISHNDDSDLARFEDGAKYTPDLVQPIVSEEEREGWSQMQLYDWLLEYYRQMHAVHVQDLSFALDQLELLNADDGDFRDRLDFDKVGALGWSRGGGTAFQATVDDERVRAAVDLDGNLFGRSVELNGSSRPLLLIENRAFYEPVSTTGVDADLQELKAAVDSYTWGMFRRTTADWYRAQLKGTVHQHYSDYIFLRTDLEEGLLDPVYTHGIINALSLQFFDKYLRGKDEAPLLTGEEGFPELLVMSAAKDE